MSNGNYFCHCGRIGEFGYRDKTTDDLLVWCCAEHRLGRYYADARRDLPTPSQHVTTTTNNDISAPPDLHELIKEFGAYSAIAAEGWSRYHVAMKQWQEDRRAYLLGGSIEERRRQQRKRTG